MLFEKVSGMMKMRAFLYSTTTVASTLMCSAQCVRHNVCMTFTFKEDPKVCKLFSTLWPDDPNVPEIKLEVGEKLFLPR
jgi:hypothetical protein